MKPEEQQISIAEFCGYRFIPMGKGPTGFYYLNCTSEEDVDLAIKGKLNGATHSYNLPDYLNDLNAIHEAEMKLTDDQYTAFQCALKRIRNVQCEPCCRCVSSPAVERCRAVLVAIGKWK